MKTYKVPGNSHNFWGSFHKIIPLLGHRHHSEALLTFSMLYSVSGIKIFYKKPSEKFSKLINFAGFFKPIVYIFVFHDFLQEIS